jgi:hypothetical protein
MFANEEIQSVLDSMVGAQKKIDAKLLSVSLTGNTLEYNYWEDRKKRLEVAIENWKFIMGR